MLIAKQFLPNLLTFFRILISPLIALFLYLANINSVYYTFAVISFTMASITDFIDGYLARMWKVQSNLGKFLDPIADKLIITTTIIMLIYVRKIDHLSIFPSLAIIFREILVAGAREFMGNMKVMIPVSYFAKVKTTVQMIALLLLIASGCNIKLTNLHYVGEAALWLAAILTIYSGITYLKIPLQHFSKTN